MDAPRECFHLHVHLFHLSACRPDWAHSCTTLNRSIAKGCPAFVLWVTNGYDPCDKEMEGLETSAAGTGSGASGGAAKGKEQAAGGAGAGTGDAPGGFAGGVGLDRLFPRLVKVASVMDDDLSLAITVFRVKTKLQPDQEAFELDELKGTTQLAR